MASVNVAKPHSMWNSLSLCSMALVGVSWPQWVWNGVSMTHTVCSVGMKCVCDVLSGCGLASVGVDWFHWMCL